jgi:hypothetical protein
METSDQPISASELFSYVVAHNRHHLIAANGNLLTLGCRSSRRFELPGIGRAQIFGYTGRGSLAGMQPIQIVKFALAMTALISGIAAAAYWYKSAEVRAPDFRLIKSHDGPSPEENPIAKWVEEVSRNNKIAALLTGLSVVCSGFLSALN